MKILAIRGENICSLQKPFEVDFSVEPLASAGLFAISGPTGAGKSTLLDVICMALYHTTPRLTSAPSRHAKVRNGNEEFGFNDPRNLIFKGASFGFAEVDFQGVDGGKYRARWQVQRKGGKKNQLGKLDKVSVTLSSLPDLGLVTKEESELKTEIVKKVGLTFPEFTRSVLLAQNEFTNFLRANDTDKASILEKITGNDIFTKIGSKVYERSQIYQNKLESLKLQTDNQLILSDEDRKQKEKEVFELRKNSEHLKGLITLMTREMEDARQLSSLGESYEAFLKKESQGKKLNAELSAKLQEAEIKLMQQQERRQALQAELLSARELDTRLATLEVEYRRSDEKLKEKSQLLHQLAQEIKERSAEVMVLSHELKAIETWQGANQKIGTWSEKWPVMRERFTGAMSCLTEKNQYKKDIKATEEKLQNLFINLSQMQKDLDNFLAVSSNRKSVMEPLAKRVAAFSFDQSEAKRSNADKELSRFKKQKELKSADLNDQALLSKLSAEIKALEEKSAQLSGELASSTQNLETLEQEKLVQQKVKDSLALKVSQSVGALRAQLVDGEDCPVCGSKSHPYAVSLAEKTMAGLLQEAESELSQIESRIKSARNRATQLTADRSAAKASAEQAASQRGTLEERISGRHDDWAKVSGGQSLTDCEISLIDQSIAQAETIVTECTRLMASWSKDNDQLRTMRSEEEADAAKTAKLTAEMQKFSLEKSKLDERRDQYLTLISKSEHDLEAELLVLDSILQDPDWRKNWQESPESFTIEIEKQVYHWQEKVRNKEVLTSKKADLNVHQTTAENLRLSVEADVKSAQADLDSRKLLLGTLKKDRSELLGGQSAEVIEHDLDKSFKALSQERDQIQQQQVSSQIELATIEEALRNTKAQQEKIKSESEERLKKLQSDSSSKGLSSDFSNIEDVLKEYQDKLKDIDSQQISLYGELDADKKLHKERDQKIAEQKTIEDLFQRWNRLNHLIGSKNGDAFKKAAQEVTLDVLLSHANYHLESFAKRYRLVRQTENLNLLVEDVETGGDQRSVYSLSGGESFLVSLSLAMGLSSLSSNQMHVESLFIDEGFGSLDAETLRIALNALDALQAQGRKVGVISHVGEMTERISVQIRVNKDGRGRSSVVPPRIFVEQP